MTSNPLVIGCGKYYGDNILPFVCGTTEVVANKTEDLVFYCPLCRGRKEGMDEAAKIIFSKIADMQFDGINSGLKFGTVAITLKEWILIEFKQGRGK